MFAFSIVQHSIRAVGEFFCSFFLTSLFSAIEHYPILIDWWLFTMVHTTNRGRCLPLEDWTFCFFLRITQFCLSSKDWTLTIWKFQVNAYCSNIRQLASRLRILSVQPAVERTVFEPIQKDAGALQFFASPLIAYSIKLILVVYYDVVIAPCLQAHSRINKGSYWMKRSKCILFGGEV